MFNPTGKCEKRKAGEEPNESCTARQKICQYRDKSLLDHLLRVIKSQGQIDVAPAPAFETFLLGQCVGCLLARIRALSGGDVDSEDVIWQE